MKTTLDARELATVLAALRKVEIAALCERLNEDEVSTGLSHVD